MMPRLALGICVALGHAVWLVAAAGCVYALARPALRFKARHRLGMLLLGGCVVAASIAGWAAVVPLTAPAGSGPTGLASALDFGGNLTPAGAFGAGGLAGYPTPAGGLPPWPLVVACMWLCGATLLLCRPLAGMVVLRRLRREAGRAARTLEEPWRSRAEAFARTIGLPVAGPRSVRLTVSEAGDVPFTYGWWQPVVVVPIAVLASCAGGALSPACVSALIEHELCHVRRGDYLWQWLQRITEALLFFHPVAWWLSRRVSEDREMACDAAVVGFGAEPLRYARALVALETVRNEGRGGPSTVPASVALSSLPSSLTVHADGAGPLMQRIRATMTPPPLAGARHTVLAAAVAALAIGSSLFVACIGDAPHPVDPGDHPPIEGQAEGAPDDPADRLAGIAWLPERITRHAARIRQTAQNSSVPEAVLALMVLVESDGDPDARSPMGAMGLLQLMPRTAREVAARHRIVLPDGGAALDTALTDPDDNLQLGALLMAELIADHGNARTPAAEPTPETLARAWAGYNAGSRALRAHLEQGVPLPDEAQRYRALLLDLYAERHAARSTAYDAWQARRKR